jgi:excinuclease ABC subunit C
MLDGKGAVLYIGKARNLRKRVSSYFHSPNRLGPKTRSMLAQVRAIEVTVTHTENEALILENNLIKDLKPRYNIVLRDDKSYPYIYLSSEQEFPRLAFHRGTRSGEGKYFGPFPNASSVRASLNLLQKLFLIRPCEDSFFRNRTRPCLQYQIKRCSAPCVGLIDAGSYRDDVEHAVMFLEGKAEGVIEHLVGRMEVAAAGLDFERAVRYRDQINQMTRVQQHQSVSVGGGDIDIIACAAREGLGCVQVFYLRGGHNLGNKPFFLSHAAEAAEAEILSAFLPQYYLADRPDRTIPPEIIVNEPLSEIGLLAAALSQRAGRKVTIHERVRGDRARCLEMAIQNAELALRQRLSDQGRWRERFEALGQALGLDRAIARIECFDVSHTRGEATVASCVVFGVEGPMKSEYRCFNITGLAPGDDYAAMREALTRYYRRRKRETLTVADVLLIDGGKGQLTQALDVLQSLQITEVCAVAVAKGPSRQAGEETLIASARQKVLELPRDSTARHLIQQIRDEAHRFAITTHRRQRARRRMRSPLEEIEGVGAKRRHNLIRHFGGLQGVARAGIGDLCQVKGISTELAMRIYTHLHEPA